LEDMKQFEAGSRLYFDIQGLKGRKKNIAVKTGAHEEKRKSTPRELVLEIVRVHTKSDPPQTKKVQNWSKRERRRACHG